MLGLLRRLSVPTQWSSQPPPSAHLAFEPLLRGLSLPRRLPLPGFRRRWQRARVLLRCERRGRFRKHRKSEFLLPKLFDQEKRKVAKLRSPTSLRRRILGRLLGLPERRDSFKSPRLGESLRRGRVHQQGRQYRHPLRPLRPSGHPADRSRSVRLHVSFHLARHRIVDAGFGRKVCSE